jgi:two-component system chemotaxis family response regulator WspR
VIGGLEIMRCTVAPGCQADAFPRSQSLPVDKKLHKTSSSSDMFSMSEVAEKVMGESPAYLRHEYRTPVNHIVGYSELLIDEAAERRLAPFIPVFQQIQEGGRRILASIENAFGEHTAPGLNWQGVEFRTSLGDAVQEMSRTLACLDKDLDRSHRETQADLAAISGAIRRLSLLGDLEIREDPEAREVPGRTEISHRHRLDDSCEVVLMPTRRRGGRILIADDDDANRHLLRRRLECDGHQVTEARNGQEVLDYLKEKTSDLVLLDIIMPVMDGFLTLARMKQDAALRDLPVIMISALDELPGVVRCIEMAAEDYLPKPFNRVLLRARIGASLEKKWLRDREREKTEELERTLSLLEKAQTELAVLASQDALTTLANRRAVSAQLDCRVKRKTPFTAIYIDLNGFKTINDVHGHAAGDELLKQVGARLRSAFRATDAVGRWGGDEFVALTDANSADIHTLVARIRESLADDFVIGSGADERRVKVGAAIGVATSKANDTASGLLHRADFAMYEEKLRTRSQTQTIPPRQTRRG